MCGAVAIPPMPICDGCVHLPVQYEKANGRTLITTVNNEWWQVNVWTPVPDTFNALTNRSLYCLTSSTIKSDIPVPVTATFGQVARTSANCLTNNGCFYTTINIIVDGFYSPLYAASVQFYSNPTLVPYLGNALPNQYLVTLGQVYNITLLVPNILCTVDLNYMPTSLGPIITTIRTKEAYCNPKVGTGAVTMCTHCIIIHRQTPHWLGRWHPFVSIGPEEEARHLQQTTKFQSNFSYQSMCLNQHCYRTYQHLESTISLLGLLVVCNK